MKSIHLRALITPIRERRAIHYKLLNEFWRECTPKELLYALKIKHALSEAKLI